MFTLYDNKNTFTVRVSKTSLGLLKPTVVALVFKKYMKHLKIRNTILNFFPFLLKLPLCCHC